MTLTFVWKGEISEFLELLTKLGELNRGANWKGKIGLDTVGFETGLASVKSKLQDLTEPEQTEKIYVPSRDSKPPKKEKVPISDETKAEILKLAASGLARKEIAKKLGIQDARRVHGIIVGSQGIKKRISTPENVAQRPRTEENVDVAQSQPETTSTTPKTQTDAIPAKSYTPAVLEGKIWDLHLAGMTPNEISEELQGDGLYFSTDAVKIRLKKMGG